MECPVVNGKRRGGDQVAFEEKEIIETEERSYRRRITCIMSCQEVWAWSQTFGGEGMLARPVPCRHGAGNSDQAKKKNHVQVVPSINTALCSKSVFHLGSAKSESKPRAVRSFSNHQGEGLFGQDWDPCMTHMLPLS